MTGKDGFSRRTLNAMHAAILVVVVVLLALVAYNYAQTGRLSLTSVVISVMLLAVVVTQRAVFGKRGAGGR